MKDDFGLITLFDSDVWLAVSLWHAIRTANVMAYCNMPGSDPMGLLTLNFNLKFHVLIPGPDPMSLLTPEFQPYVSYTHPWLWPHELIDPWISTLCFMYSSLALTPWAYWPPDFNLMFHALIPGSDLMSLLTPEFQPYISCTHPHELIGPEFQPFVSCTHPWLWPHERIDPRIWTLCFLHSSLADPMIFLTPAFQP